MFSATYRLRLPGFRRISRDIQPGSSALRTVYYKWAVRYRAFIQQRWDRYSKGGGDWPPLKYRTGSILRDTNTMFNAMAPTINAPPGSINRVFSDGIEVGFGGSAYHPGGPTIQQLSEWHQIGAGFLPERPIIVPPDSRTQRGMTKDLQDFADQYN